MFEADHDYFQARAEQELARAKEARDPRAVKAHYKMAAYYLDLVQEGGISKVPTAAPARWR